MDSLHSLADGFLIALTWQNLGLALIGCILGTIIGALPGLEPSNGVAILIPLAFSLGLPVTPALILLMSVYYGAMYGGRISSILLNIPGDEPALMTTLDGYLMARKGQTGEALSISGIASFVESFFVTWGRSFWRRNWSRWRSCSALPNILSCLPWRLRPWAVSLAVIRPRQPLPLRWVWASP